MNRKKVITAVIAYLISAGVYLAFFSYPVSPASADPQNYVLEKEEVISHLPYAVYRMYVRNSMTQPAILVVATIRTPFVPSKTFSSNMHKVEGILEEKVKEEYGVDIDVVFVNEFKAKVGGHETVMQEYDIHLKYLNPYSFGTRPDTIKMDLGAYFCNERYESIIVGYVYPPIYADDFQEVMASISC